MKNIVDIFNERILNEKMDEEKINRHKSIKTGHMIIIYKNGSLWIEGLCIAKRNKKIGSNLVILYKQNNCKILATVPIYNDIYDIKIKSFVKIKQSRPYYLLHKDTLLNRILKT